MKRMSEWKFSIKASKQRKSRRITQRYLAKQRKKLTLPLIIEEHKPTSLFYLSIHQKKNELKQNLGFSINLAMNKYENAQLTVLRMPLTQYFNPLPLYTLFC